MDHQPSCFIAVLLAATSLATLTNAQSLLQGPNGSAVPVWGLSTKLQGGNSTICNQTFAQANATGIFSINPNVAQGPQAGQPDNHSGNTLASMFAVTVANPGFNNVEQDSSSFTLWYNTNGANYSNDYALGYDVCAIAGLAFNYNTQLRGQNDDGSCSSTLNSACINAIKAHVQQQATWLTTPSPGPNSNLTNTSLPGICRQLAYDISHNIPSSCAEFFQDSSAAIGWPLTTYGNDYETALFSDCRLNGTWYNTLGIFNNASQAVYEAWVHAVTPVIGIWMPIASYSQTGSEVTIAETVAEVACGHVQSFSEGSYEPPAAPSPTPIASDSNGTASATASASSSHNNSSGDGLSGGAIAGIVIGVLASLAIIAAIIALVVWRRRKSKESKHNIPIQEISGEQTRYELGGQDAKSQLPATPLEGGTEKPRKISELTGTESPRGELEGKQVMSPVELPGSTPKN